MNAEERLDAIREKAEWGLSPGKHPMVKTQALQDIRDLASSNASLGDSNE